MMNYLSAAFQNFSSYIAGAIAVTALAGAFEVASQIAPKKEEAPKKPECVEKRDTQSGLAIYNENCPPAPARK